jgi:hypothetical protein
MEKKYQYLAIGVVAVIIGIIVFYFWGKNQANNYMREGKKPIGTAMTDHPFTWDELRYRPFAQRVWMYLFGNNYVFEG